jgi:hypothetical protein
MPASNKRPADDALESGGKKARAEVLVFYQFFDRRAMNHILNNWRTYGLLIDDKDRNRTRKLMNTLLKKGGKEGLLRSAYTQRAGQSRYHSPESMQSLWRVIKHTVAGELHHDIDMVNSQPTLFLRFCDKQGIPANALRKYVENREDHLSELMDSMELDPDDIDSRDTVKGAFNKIMNLGKLPPRCPGWVRDIKAECIAIAGHLEDHRPDIWEAAEAAAKEKNSGNVRGKALARLYFELEWECLSAIIAELDARGFLTHERVPDGRVGGIMFDGIEVPRRGPGEFDKAVLREIEAAVLERTGWEIGLREKPMNTRPEGFPESLEGEDGQEQDEEGMYHDVLDMRDTTLAEHIANTSPDTIAAFTYCCNTKTWYQQENGAWYGAAEPISVRLAVYDYLKPYWENLDVKEAPTDAKLNSTVNALKMYKSVRNMANLLNSDWDAIACTDQVYRFSTDAWEPLTPGHYVSLTTGYMRPEPDEVIQEKIMATLAELWDTKEDLKYVLCVLAVALLGGNLEQEFYLWTGEGANGKTLLLELMMATLGDYMDSMDEATFTKPSRSQNDHTDLGRCNGWRIFSIDETAEDAKLQMNIIKKLSGNSKVAARGAYATEPTLFRSSATGIMSCNKKPGMTACNAAERRRMRVINFPMTFFFESDKNYDRANPRHKTRDNKLEALFNTPVYGAQMLLILINVYKEYIRGKPAGVLQDMRTEFHIANTEEYFREQCPITVWILDNYTVTRDAEDWEPTSLLHGKCQEWLKRVSPQKIFQAIKRLGVIKQHTKHGDVYKGIRLKTDDDRHAELVQGI